MQKRGQLGAIEFKYFMTGLFIGIVAGLVFLYLSSTNVVPVPIPLVCT